MNAQQTRPLIRTVAFATHPIQYHTPVWRRLAGTPGIDLLVVFGTDMSVRGYTDEGFGVAFKWDTPLLEGYRSIFLSKDPRIERIRFSRPSARGIGSILKEFRPHVGILTAYSTLFHLGAFAALRRQRVPVIMRHEASDVAVIRGGLKTVVRDFLLRRLYARIDRFAVIGTEAHRHLQRLGVADDRMDRAPYCVDTDFVGDQVEQWLPKREALRAEMGIAPGDCALVFSGKLIPKKDPLLMAQALRLLAGDPDPSKAGLVERIHVIVAGDGQLREPLREALQAVIGKRAHLLGFLNQGEMGRAYAAGDALLLPSRRGAGETWGLVVNEAMQYGLPAIISDGVGCHPDLVREGETGWVFRAGNAAELALRISDFHRQEGISRQSMRAAVLSRMVSFSSDAAVAGLVQAVAQAARK